MSAVWSQARDAGYGDNERLMPITLHNEHIAAFEPQVQFTKPIGASLDLDAKIAASNRQDDIVARLVFSKTEHPTDCRTMLTTMLEDVRL